MEYPIELPKQIKFLKENKDFFLTFGPITEPYENKIVSKIAEEVKDEPFKVGKAIAKNFRKVQVDIQYYFSVKFMEDHRIVGGCSEFAFLTAAILRKAGYPTAIADALVVDSIFQDPTRKRGFEEHSVNLVYIDDRWWLYDSTSIYISRFITTRMLHQGMLIGAIYRDPYDIKVRNRIEKYANLLYNLKDILLLDIQEDVLNWRNYPVLKKRIEDLSGKK